MIFLGHNQFLNALAEGFQGSRVQAFTGKGTLGLDVSNPSRKRLYSFLLNIIFQDKPVYAIFFYANGAQNSLGITNPTHCSLTAYYVVASPFKASKNRHSIRPLFQSFGYVKDFQLPGTGQGDFLKVDTTRSV